MASKKKGTDADLTEILSLEDDGTRLYKRVARRLVEELQSGRYQVGDRMPAERDLAAELSVSRTVVREAMLALEVLGLIEVRMGAGTFVQRLPACDEDSASQPGFDISPFELLEARMAIEGEAAALAAVQISPEEIVRLETLIAAIGQQNKHHSAEENADMAFHTTIARATRNSAIEKAVEELWRQRWASPSCKLLLQKARTANVLPMVDEHTAIVDALKHRDPNAARTAMRTHLAAVIQHLLFAVEEQALEEARKAAASTRQRYGNFT
ncbi:FadR family transcriptional regulator [Novosphingobium sp. 1949]|uniref:FadR family transcriptional regulator n=1 Tax=Novosphingobium organovorum TaxID=2930092 RepID=A0ABT0BCT4_9SPHN|nr:FadR/GntR family transcriptional regulator [Novosphingobium organovorum]MCJ2182886.1 FadR family transcriptional regulator [Novosphingobium organovorum]